MRPSPAWVTASRIIRSRPLSGPGGVFPPGPAMAENGGWPPHLHFQVITDLLDRGTDFPGVALAAERGIWAELSPSPNLLLRIAAEGVVADEKDVADTLADRERVLGGNLGVSYR